ncbi:MAG: carbohydrate binding domain-containing protein, partial [Chloroflexota bacterium]|nr:carbohydrate binding domain-containing protein [Chloroflexota bacterium]
MTEPTFGSDEPVQRPTSGGGLAAAIAPEGVAAVLAIVLVAALLTVRLAGLSSTGSTATPRPSGGPASPVPTAPRPAFDRVAIGTVLGVNERLLDFGRALQSEIDRAPVSTDKVRNTMTQMNVQILAGAPAAARLREAPATALVGADLSAVYDELRAELDAANDFKLSEEVAWRTAAAGVVETLQALPPIDLRLQAIRAGLPDPAGPVVPSNPPTLVPTASPLPSASPIVTAPPTAPPTIAPPTPGPSVPPSFGPTPTPSLAEPNQLRYPGFEEGIQPWWNLVLANPNVRATVATDLTSPHSGKASARIDVSAVDGIPQSIVLRQDGVTLEQGAYYRVSISLRSSAPRQVRVRVISATPPDQTYATNQLSVSTAWTVHTYEFTTFVGGSGRRFSIEVGQT